MRVKCEIILELDTGDYELKLHNLTEPGEPIDQARIMKVLERVFQSWDDQQHPAAD